MLPAPPTWGNDGLTEYLDAVRGNQFATFNNKKYIVEPLIKIDRLFGKITNNIVNPRPLAPMMFLVRTHSAYRAAAASALSGQVFESQCLLRLCLEHAACGIYIGDDQDRYVRWLKRHESAKNKKSIRNEFTFSKYKSEMNAASVTIGSNFTDLYEELIDYGAHPNEKGFSLSTSITKNENGDRLIDTVMLHTDGAALRHGLGIVARVGTWSLHAFRLIYPTRFELVGVSHELNSLRQKFGPN